MDTLAQIANSIYDELRTPWANKSPRPKFIIDVYGQLYIITIKHNDPHNDCKLTLRIRGHTPQLNYDIEVNTTHLNLLLTTGQLTDPNSLTNIITTINEYLPISYEEKP